MGFCNLCFRAYQQSTKSHLCDASLEIHSCFRIVKKTNELKAIVYTSLSGDMF